MNTRLLIPVIALFALAACGGGGGGGGGGGETPDPPPVGRDGSPLSRKIDPDGSRIDPVSDCADLRGYVAAAIAEQFLSSPYCFDCPVPLAVTDAVAAAPPPPSLAAAPTSVTGTNVQEAGVDESDIIKADANGNLLIAVGDTLYIADAFPPGEMSLASQLEFDGYIDGLFLIEDSARAIVFLGGITQPLPADGTALVAPDYGTTVVFLDISDLSRPVETARRWLDGYLRTSRRIGDRVHMVTVDYMRAPDSLYQSRTFQDLLVLYSEARNSGDEDRTDDLAADIRAFIADEVANAPIDDYLPAGALSVDGGPFTDVLPLPCDDVLKPDVAISLGMTVITSFDVDGDNYSAKGVVISPYDLYASASSLYLLQTSHAWWWHPLQADQTAIHRFAISAGAAEYQASALVDGIVNGRHSLSEHDGHLRVATGDRRWDDAADTVRLTNHLFVLADDGAGELRQTGVVRDFAPGETIFSTRYMGDRGFVVTFRQIDPLFAFDLSDPAAPHIAGELEIPGFSTYMHPYDDNHLLTIGQDGTATGAVPRIKLQLFDVTNLDDPRLLHSLVPGFGDIEPENSWSPASYDPRAFTFLAAESLLSLPMFLRDANTASMFTGFLAFDVNIANGITERSRVDHSDIAAEHGCGASPPDPADCPWHFVAPLRSVIMTTADETYLYSLSQVGLKATTADDGQTALGSLHLP